MNRTLLVLNAGSSSIKFALYSCTDAPEPAPAWHGQVEGIGGAARISVQQATGPVATRELAPHHAIDHAAALAAIWAWLDEQQLTQGIAAVGHRVVHGGGEFAGPVRIEADVVRQLERLAPLAPLQQPSAINAIRNARERFPGVLQVACFDTAFHHDLPALAQAVALPRELTAAGIRRYGFHGLSYEYVAGWLAATEPVLATGRVIVAHLGAGSSLCALRAGASQATTMGFSTLDGVMMATRCGSLDPGVLLYLMKQHGMDHDALESLLYRRSGLLGVSGRSGDIRELLACDDAQARAAIDLFVYGINRELGALAAVLGGLDGLVFTGGIGLGSAIIRARVCSLAAWLGVQLDPVANAAGARRISTADSRVAVLTVATDENLVIARHTLRLLH
jgi:acetate kinase